MTSAPRPAGVPRSGRSGVAEQAGAAFLRRPVLGAGVAVSSRCLLVDRGMVRFSDLPGLVGAVLEVHLADAVHAVLGTVPDVVAGEEDETGAGLVGARIRRHCPVAVLGAQGGAGLVDGRGGPFGGKDPAVVVHAEAEVPELGQQGTGAGAGGGGRANAQGDDGSDGCQPGDITYSHAH